MNNVAFVTYNSVGDGLSSGWHDGPHGRRALVLQNTRGAHRAVRADTPDDQCAQLRRSEIETLWGQLQEVRDDLHHVVVYVGVAGSERAIELASTMSASKVTVVACSCALPVKERLLQEAGLRDVGRVLCECGGHRTMRHLYETFMATGALQPVAA